MPKPLATAITRPASRPRRAPNSLPELRVCELPRCTYLRRGTPQWDPILGRAMAHAAGQRSVILWLHDVCFDVVSYTSSTVRQPGLSKHIWHIVRIRDVAYLSRSTDARLVYSGEHHRLFYPCQADVGLGPHGRTRHERLY